MKIPDDQRVVTDRRLTIIKAVSQLYDRFVDCKDGLKDQVKEALRSKKAKYAQSDLATARLQPGGKTVVDAAKCYALIAAGQLTLDQFLSAASINGKALEEILSGAQIDEIGTWRPYASPALYIDWKEGVTFDAEALMQAIEDELAATAVGTRKRRAG